MRLYTLLAVFLAVCALVSVACSTAAEMIPGQGEDGTPAAPTASPVAVGPLVAPATVRLAGAGGDAANRPALSDADLARTVVQVRALNPEGGPVREGSGVIVDRVQRLVLTSYLLVDPFTAEGTRAYDRLVAGAGGSPPPGEVPATIVATNAPAGFAVLRLNEGTFELEAQLADSSTLKRGDRLRFVALEADRARPPLVVNGTVTGFRGDAGGDGRSWLKTDARLPIAAAGGPAFDQSGTLVGVVAQLAYDPGAPAGGVRPLANAVQLIKAAREAGPNPRAQTALQHPPLRPGSITGSTPPDAVVVSQPAFAENALTGQGFRDLFDYVIATRADIPELHYEFAAQGVRQGTPVQELWYLNGVLQDGLSSSYNWNLGGFAVVSDRLVTPNARGIPQGTWRLEVWVGGQLRTSGTVFVGVSPPRAAVEGFRFAATASPGQLPLAPASSASGQLLAFFNYKDAAGVQALRWVVSRDGRVVYESPTVPWRGGHEGTWWVGMPGDGGPIGPGRWDVQVFFDNTAAGADGVQLQR